MTPAFWIIMQGDADESLVINVCLLLIRAFVARLNSPQCLVYTVDLVRLEVSLSRQHNHLLVEYRRTISGLIVCDCILRKFPVLWPLIVEKIGVVKSGRRNETDARNIRQSSQTKLAVLRYI